MNSFQLIFMMKLNSFNNLEKLFRSLAQLNEMYYSHSSSFIIFTSYIIKAPHSQSIHELLLLGSKFESAKEKSGDKKDQVQNKAISVNYNYASWKLICVKNMYNCEMKLQQLHHSDNIAKVLVYSGIFHFWSRAF